MYIAAQNGRMPVVHLLAKMKANVHLSRKRDNCTPFYAAADKGYDDILRYLAALKADVNCTTTNGNWCPLKIAAYRKFDSTVQTIVELGANEESIRAAAKIAATTPAISRMLDEAARPTLTLKDES